MSQPLCLDAEIYLAVLSALPDAVVVADLGGALLFCNAAAETLLPGGIAGLGGSGDRPDYQVLDQQQWPLMPPELHLGRVLAGQRLHNEEFILVVGQPPQPRWVACSGELSSGMALLTLRDISAAKQQEASLVQQAFYDPLTGLPNRHLFVDRLGQALACAQDDPQRVMALLVIGLEQFKRINDNLGHQVGDEMLVELGIRLQAQVGPNDIVARPGRDEFAILLDNLTSHASAIALTEAIHAVVQQPFGLQRQISVNAGIGVAFGSKSYQNAFDWLRDADSAMDQVKDHPDLGWQVFDSSLRVDKDLRLQTEVDLRQAIDRNELRLHYQPIVTINNREIRGFEALVRWQHPTRGLLMPGEFIDIAEASGLIIPLGWWVLTEACRQMQMWTEQ